MTTSKPSTSTAAPLTLAQKLAMLDDAQRDEAFRLLQEVKRRRSQRKLYGMFPEEGPLRRELYPRHMEFFEATSEFKEICFMAANRVGKTEAGTFALATWATGIYPDWWVGLRFDRPVSMWAAGDTAKTTRDILQEKLLGPPGALGTGMVPGDRIIKCTPKAGVPDAVDTIYVKCVDEDGDEIGVSSIGLKSFDQGRIAFQGTAQDVVLLDEEPPMDVYTECLTRTMTTKGIVVLTFTPLKGITPLVMSFQTQEGPGQTPF